MARGVSAATGAHVSPSSKKSSLSIQSTAAMAPTARVLVYCMTQNGEVVVDSLNVKIDDPFENQVTTAFLFVFVSDVNLTCIIYCDLMEWRTGQVNKVFQKNFTFKFIFKINIYWKKSKLCALEIADIVDSSSF